MIDTGRFAHKLVCRDQKSALRPVGCQPFRPPMWEEPNPIASNSRSLTISLTNQRSRECEMHAPHVGAGREEEEGGSDRGVGFREVVRKVVCVVLRGRFPS